MKNDLLKLQTDLANIRCRVWIVHGVKDVYVPVGNAEFSKKMLVNARPVTLTIIPGSNHFVSDKHYELVKDVFMNLY